MAEIKIEKKISPVIQMIREIKEKDKKSQEERKEVKPKRRGNPEMLKKMWADIKAGKRPPLPKPWSKKKAKKEELKKVKPKESSPDEKAEKIKEGLNVSDADFLKEKEKPTTEQKEITTKEPKGIDFSWLIYGIAGVVILFLLIQLFKKGSTSSPLASVSETPKQDYYEIPRADGSMIKIPKVKR